MKWIARISIIVCLLLASAFATVAAYRWADGMFRARMHENYEFKRMHVSSGRVVSVSKVKLGQQGEGSGEDSPHYKICFSIDSFSDIPSDLQEEYAAAERARTIKEGPHCIISRQTSLPSNLKPGDALEVNYLLYGSGVITVERLVVAGKDIDAS
jgi:hypothetical protein